MINITKSQLKDIIKLERKKIFREFEHFMEELDVTKYSILKGNYKRLKQRIMDDNIEFKELPIKPTKKDMKKTIALIPNS